MYIPEYIICLLFENHLEILRQPDSWWNVSEHGRVMNYI